MKSKFAFAICGVACVLFCYSCKKNGDNKPTTPPTPSSEKVMVHLKSGGEFTTYQTPISGARQTGKDVAAKTRQDSTYYAVSVLVNDTIYASGIFDNPDSIMMLLERNKPYRFVMAIMQRGLGAGLYVGDPYEWSEEWENYAFLRGPVYGPITNHMLYKYETYPLPGGISPFGNSHGGRMFVMDISDPNSWDYNVNASIAEIITFYGDTSITAIDTLNPNITIPSKRLSFGVTYDCPELTQGELRIKYETYSPGVVLGRRFLKPGKTDTVTIFSCTDYAAIDTLPRDTYYFEYTIFVNIEYINALGASYSLGRKKLPLPRRNKLVNIHVDLPGSGTPPPDGSSMDIRITETPFYNGPTIRF